MGATETVDLFFELINDDQREKAIALFAENAVMGISVPGSDERTNLRGRDRVGGWFVRAGDGFRMYTNDSRNMGGSYIADVTVMRPGVQSMHVEANFRVEGGEIVSLFLQPIALGEEVLLPGHDECRGTWIVPAGARERRSADEHHRSLTHLAAGQVGGRGELIGHRDDGGAHLATLRVGHAPQVVQRRRSPPPRSPRSRSRCAMAARRSRR